MLVSEVCLTREYGSYVPVVVSVCADVSLGADIPLAEIVP